MITYYKNTEDQLIRKASKNFLVQEYQCKCHKCPYTIIDSELTMRVQLLRDLLGFPLHINSANRCWVHNKAEDGVSHSDHIIAKAVDLQLPISEDLMLAMLNYITAIFPYHYNGGTFVHCSIVPR